MTMRLSPTSPASFVPIRLGRGAAFLLLGGGYLLTFVGALPDGGGWNSAPSSSRAPVGGGGVGGAGRDGRGGGISGRGSVTLRDSFPCEADPTSSAAAAAASSSGSEPAESGAAPPPPANYLNANSFMALNGLDATGKPSAAESCAGAPRGGATKTDKPFMPLSSSLDDDALDRIVDDLIAGMDDESEEDESDLDEANGEGHGGGSDDEKIGEADEDEEEAEEVGIGGCALVEEDDADAERGANKADIGAARDFHDGMNREDPASPQIPKEGSSSRTDAGLPSALPRRRLPSLSAASPVTPTNAYYRFLVRRGPKGHILAALTLIVVQWIHNYIPILYGAVASVLLKLRIYDPKILHERERQRLMRAKYGDPKKKGGLTSKLFGSSREKKATAQRQRDVQKREDEDAASKLKQLYRAMKEGGGAGMLSEVKYRYLSEAFRRRHGLGREYQVQNPRAFMGEVVEGATLFGDDRGKETGEDDIIFSDEEAEDTQAGVVDSSQAVGSIARGRSKRRKSVQPQKQRRRSSIKRIDDWVVRAFVKSPRWKPPSAETTSVSVSTGSDLNEKGSNSDGPPASLWSTVERSAIIDAAWQSRAAERQARSRAVGGNEEDDGAHGGTANAATSDGGAGMERSSGSGANNGGYGASKMFQSVMTRVGSNGRIFGAYPNDAPSIEECANERGVIGLARKYGYGDWREIDTMERDVVSTEGDEDDRDNELDSWGGGIFDGEVVGGLEEDSSLPPSTRGLYQGSVGRRKERRPSIATDGKAAGSSVGKSKKRRRSGKGKKESRVLGVSGGGHADSNHVRGRFTIDFGISVSSSKPRVSGRSHPYQSAATSTAFVPPVRQRDTPGAKSRQEIRKASSILFKNDAKIRAPMQLLNESENRLGKQRDSRRKKRKESSILFANDATIKARMQQLNESAKRPEKNEGD